MLHSIIGLTVKNLKFFRTIELKAPRIRPVNTENILNDRKLPIILNGVDDVN